MPKQVNISLDDETYELLEKLAVSESVETKKRTTISEQVRKGIHLLALDGPIDRPINRLYVTTKKDKGKNEYKKIEIWHGDVKSDVDLLGFDLLVVYDDQYNIKKIDAALLVNHNLAPYKSYEPSLFSIVLPKDLLKIVEPYEFSMNFTYAKSIYGISRFDGISRFNKDFSGFSEVKYSETYETVVLPEIAMRCRRIKHHRASEWILWFSNNITPEGLDKNKDKKDE